MRAPDAGEPLPRRLCMRVLQRGFVLAFPEVTVGYFISQSLLFIILAFILGVIVGRLWKKAPEKPTEPPVADDPLERIEGVGPAMANALRAAGIRTFTQLAESDDDTKRNAIKAAGLSFAPSMVTWSRQARLLADGDEAAFAILTARLIAGRDTDQPTTRPAPKPAARAAGRPTGTSPTAPTSGAAPSTAPTSETTPSTAPTSGTTSSTAATSGAAPSTPSPVPAPADPSSWSAIPSPPEPSRPDTSSSARSTDPEAHAAGPRTMAGPDALSAGPDSFSVVSAPESVVETRTVAVLDRPEAATVTADIVRAEIAPESDVKESDVKKSEPETVAGSKKSAQKKSDSRKNDGKKGDRKKSGRGSEASAR
ncbi:hypothetical protein GCM10009828_092440 [Actinoplanes couchii]|uniref:Helix-hairpin-helix domain-containing protein n=1 Tax=Actinoplanes couchii TaxID=403638 RepID=A0ABQ3XGS6_9ACTN|nr:hypothetical protein Aco03nite_061000 [Actinoplanes couchii]